MVVETHVDVLPFGIVMAYAIASNSPILANTHQMVQLEPMVVMLDLNAKLQWTIIDMSPNKHLPKCVLCCAFILVLF